MEQRPTPMADRRGAGYHRPPGPLRSEDPGEPLAGGDRPGHGGPQGGPARPHRRALSYLLGVVAEVTRREADYLDRAVRL